MQHVAYILLAQASCGCYHYKHPQSQLLDCNKYIVYDWGDHCNSQLCNAVWEEAAEVLEGIPRPASSLIAGRMRSQNSLPSQIRHILPGTCGGECKLGRGDNSWNATIAPAISSPDLQAADDHHGRQPYVAHCAWQHGLCRQESSWGADLACIMPDSSNSAWWPWWKRIIGKGRLWNFMKDFVPICFTNSGSAARYGVHVLGTRCSLVNGIYSAG